MAGPAYFRRSLAWVLGLVLAVTGMASQVSPAEAAPKKKVPPAAQVWVPIDSTVTVTPASEPVKAPTSDKPAKVTRPQGKGAAAKASDPVVAAKWREVAGVSALQIKSAGAASVEVAPEATTRKLGVSGVVFQATVDAGQSLQIQLDYSQFVDVAGASYASRMRLVSLPACALVTPDKAECQIQTSLPDSDNDGKATVTATVASDTGKPATPDAVTSTAMAATTTMVLATATDTSGSQGAFTATPLATAGSWTGGGSSGAFTYSYGVNVPKAAGPSPEVTLGYSSQTVDGRIASSNNQASWIGQGWDYQPGFIDRSYRACADDPAGTAPKTYDQCWAGQVLNLSLKGTTYQLVYDTARSVWRTAGSDSSLLIENLTGATNGANNGEYWRVTGEDGTRYYFGFNYGPGRTTQAATNSTWTVPVYGAHAGEPCYSAAGFAASKCNQAWRWNLDYVEDVHGNAALYYYTPETNNYGANNTTTATPYTRGGTLARIDYGLRNVSNNVYATAAPFSVSFTTTERCIVTSTFSCDPSLFTAANATNWPDVPVDQNCKTAPCNSHAPTFWSTKRLTTITSQVLVGSTVKPVDRYDLVQSFPAGTSDLQLWLNSIQRTGYDAAGTTLAVPAVTFAGQLLDNRVDGYNGMPRMLNWRLSAITNETGVTTNVTYSSPDCTASSVPTDLANNTRRCFPVYWVHPSASTPVLDFFHKYVVLQADSADPNFSNAKRRVAYTYVGTPAWHYTQSELQPTNRRTYDTWRGYSAVVTRSGDPAVTVTGVPDALTVSQQFYLRGMSGDILPNNQTRSVSVSVNNVSQPDDDWLAGSTYRTETYNGDDLLKPLDATFTTYTTVGGVLATRPRTGLPDLTSRLVRPSKSFHVTYDVNATGSTTTTTTPSYDTYGNQNSSQSEATGAETGCTATKYTPATGQIRNRPYQVTHYTGTCLASGDPTFTQIIDQQRTYYDGQALGAMGSRGLATTTESSVSATGGAIKYAKAEATYDAAGRPLTGTSYPDSANTTIKRVTTTAYTPAMAWPVTGITMVNSASQTSSVTLDPHRGQVVQSKSVVDTANNTATNAQYDQIGRLTKVWAPGLATTVTPASQEYSYTLSQTAPDTVSTKVLVDTGTVVVQVPGTAISDAFGTVVQTQQKAVGAANRLITDTITDSHGWTVKTNDQWYTTGVPTTTMVTAADTGISHRTLAKYDRAGRPTAVATYQGTTLVKTDKTFYDGHTTIALPQVGTATQINVDARGRQTLQRLLATPPTDNGTGWVNGLTSTGLDTTTSYDPAGRKATMVQVNTDPGGSNFTWSWGYDLAGRTITNVDPDAGTSTTVYNDLGETLQTVSSRTTNNITSFVTDALGRTVEQWAGAVGTGTKQATQVYSASTGQLTRSTLRDNGNDYTTDSTYDTLGRVTKTTTAIPTAETGLSGTYTIDQTWTSTGLPRTTTYTNPTGTGLPTETTTTNYNNDGKPTTLTGTIGTAPTPYVNATVYDPYGAVSQIAEHNPATSFVSYYRDAHTLALNRASFYVDTNFQAAEFIYNRDVALRITSATENLDTSPIRTQCYKYDNYSRLTEAWTALAPCAATPTTSSIAAGYDPIWQSWTYNGSDQRLTQTNHGLAAAADTTTTNNYVPGTHRLAAATTTKAGATVATTTHSAYDTTGNVTQRTVGTNTQTLTYDNRNNLTELKVNGTTATKYVRGTDGNVLIRRDQTSTTLYLGDQEFTRTNTGTVTGSRRYNHAGTLIAERTAPTVGTGRLTLEFTDPNGTATLAADWTTSDTSQHWNDPYGNQLDQSTDFTPWPLTTGRGFLNKPTSPTTGIIDMGARAYDPTLGQFLTLDPILDTTNTHTLNGYSYTGHEPINHTDPTGLMVACGSGGASCSLYGDAADQDWTSQQVLSQSTSSGTCDGQSGGSSSYDYKKFSETSSYTGAGGYSNTGSGSNISAQEQKNFLWGLAIGLVDVATPLVISRSAFFTHWTPGEDLKKYAASQGAQVDSIECGIGWLVSQAAVAVATGSVTGWASRTSSAITALPVKSSVTTESALSSPGVAAKAEVPLIKAGSSGGETAGKVFPNAVKQQVLEENPNICVYCRMETESPQVDHAIPRARGGDATFENGQTTCSWCNASKGARDFPVNPPPGFEGAWPPVWWGPS